MQAMHACQQTVAIFSCSLGCLFSMTNMCTSMTSIARFLTMGTGLSEVIGKPEREVSQNEMHGRLQTGWCGHFQEDELTLAVSLAQVLPVQGAL